MSQLGQTQSLARAIMAALPSTADIGQGISCVRFVTQTLTLYSMTSLARSRIDVGNSMFNALAVLRLTANSNLIGNSIGRSAGLAPTTERNAASAIGMVRL